MSNSKMKALENYYKPKYDSDEDLDNETRRKLTDANPLEAEKIRDEAWDKADLYPKLKRSLKSAWYGDKRKKED